MADVTTRTGPPGAGYGQAQDVRASEATSDATSTAQDVAGQAKDKAQDAADQAKEKAQEATQKARGRITEQVDQRSTQAGEQVGSTASDLRTVGQQLREQGQETPAKLAEQAAERTERLGGYLRDSDADKILSDVEDFARRQPWAVAAGGLLLGFAASRFLKASSSERYQARQQVGTSVDRSPADPITEPTPTVPAGPAVPVAHGAPVPPPAPGFAPAPAPAPYPQPGGARFQPGQVPSDGVRR
jgi:ElaB/YqjD/DUF883 family membrane-anchored ribosome-binding protein